MQWKTTQSILYPQTPQLGDGQMAVNGPDSSTHLQVQSPSSSWRVDAAWAHFKEAETGVKEDVGGRQPPRVEVRSQSKWASVLSPLALENYL